MKWLENRFSDQLVLAKSYLNLINTRSGINKFEFADNVERGLNGMEALRLVFAEQKIDMLNFVILCNFENGLQPDERKEFLQFCEAKRQQLGQISQNPEETIEMKKVWNVDTLRLWLRQVNSTRKHPKSKQPSQMITDLVLTPTFKSKPYNRRPRA
jgi:hypothetical protein